MTPWSHYENSENWESQVRWCLQFTEIAELRFSFLNFRTFEKAKKTFCCGEIKLNSCELSHKGQIKREMMDSSFSGWSFVAWTSKGSLIFASIKRLSCLILFALSALLLIRGRLNVNAVERSRCWLFPSSDRLYIRAMRNWKHPL